MRYFITFSYDGTCYHGWQVQPNAATVQERLNDALSKLLPTPTECVGAGRTDTGVHASKMVAHFDTEQSLDVEQFAFRLNRILPEDIAVDGVKQVDDDLHARFSAILRTYHYFVYTKKNPYRRHYAHRLTFVPNYELMNQAAALLLDAEDFTSFSKLNNDQKTNICDVQHARWVQIEEDYWRFEITANRFLRNMVRAVVGTLLEVGRGRMSIDEFRKVIAAQNRCSAGESVAANALFLVDVQY
ncbi:tRNA pseudouridine(38-40) synthase TruA [Alloprevotella sp. Lung230]|uniref:tRNA pseudouridine(38-40) synthase TruA n=1 Tax=Alloprevotella sp. Lung230 TaxID=2766595 RepID=UPI001654D3AB|nr:tRNA pseudouridine(38-40) synthase TruA [Alloprevotella sp. Lung230]MBC8625622.1 tRNA pseudouridine(38-40) synthase TruA [Alloprevotella sp. Lung230]